MFLIFRNMQLYRFVSVALHCFLHSLRCSSAVSYIESLFCMGDIVGWFCDEAATEQYKQTGAVLQKNHWQWSTKLMLLFWFFMFSILRKNLIYVFYLLIKVLTSIMKTITAISENSLSDDPPELRRILMAIYLQV